MAYLLSAIRYYNHVNILFLKKMRFIQKLSVCLMLFAVVSCSKNDEDYGLGGKGTHNVSVFPVKVGLLRSADIEIFVSEAPFESYDTFEPLGSVKVPEDSKITDSVNVDVSDFLGKKLYFTPLRKYLLSENYYSILSSASQVEPVTVEEATTEYKVSFVVTEPSLKSYTQDKARMTLTVKKGDEAVGNKEVYWNGVGDLSQEMIDIIETRYSVDQSVAQTSMSSTGADGTLVINLPVNELGIVESESGSINYNKHVFFVIDNGKVKPVTVEIASLEFNTTLQY